MGQPIPDQLLVPRVVPIEVFLERLAALEDWLWGRGWGRLGLGRLPRLEQLAREVTALSDLYTTGRQDGLAQAADPRFLPARVLYFLLSDAAKPALVLRELAERWGRTAPPADAARSDSDSSSRLYRILDVGAGVGATTVGALLALDAARHERVRVTALDQDDALAPLWEPIAHQAARLAGLRLEADFIVRDLRTPADFRLTRPWDLLLCQSLLNELRLPTEQAAAWLADYGSRGLSVVIEPALRETTRPLHQARDRVLAGGPVRVLAPCLHQERCPMLAGERDWCHDVRLLEPPPRLAQVQALTLRRDQRVKFSFVALAPRRFLPDEAAGPVASPSAAPAPDVTGRLVSDPLGSKGKTERVLCTDAGRLVRLRLLDREATAENRALINAPRGAVVAVAQAPELPRVGPASTAAVIGM